MRHPVLGEIVFDDKGWAELEVTVNGTSLTVSIEAITSEPTGDELNALAAACRRFDELSGQVLAKAREGELLDIIRTAFSLWTEDDQSLLSAIDRSAASVEDVPPERFVELLALDEIRLHAGSDEDTIVFDFRFQLDEEIDYVVAGKFDAHLLLVDATMES